MDRTSWVAVIVCAVLLLLWGRWSAQEAARIAEEKRADDAAKPVETEKESPSGTTPISKTSPADRAKTVPEKTGVPDEKSTPKIAESKKQLSNGYVRLHLTSRGAGIQAAELLKYNRHLNDSSEKVTLNRTAPHPVGDLSTGPGEFDASVWSVKSQTSTSVTYQTDTPQKLHIEKTFSLPEKGEDPYELGLAITIRNDSGTPLQTGTKFLYTGSAAPLHINEWAMQIGFYWLNGAKDFNFKTSSHFGGKKVFGVFGKSQIPYDKIAINDLKWAGVNDQYFTTLLKPESPSASTMWVSRYPVVIDGNKELSEKKKLFATEAGVGMPDLALNRGDQSTLRYEIYMGPKELSRLKKFGDGRERVMHYDKIPIFGWFFGWAIKPIASFLITALVFMHGKLGSFGASIILVTVLIRLLIWPVYAKSTRSMKRMSKLTPLMKELKEKYPDDPQKLNEETMKLYRTYGVNPLGGCLPMFIQMPVFLSFYRMLWGAVELRHESFLWVKDLAMPDTLFQIPWLDQPFNLLPILMALSTFVQMAITPQTGDKTQRMIFMLMPFMFLFICYNFASALSLYWTTSNLFSIFQTWLMNKLPEPELKEKKGTGKKGFLQRLQEQAEAQQRARKNGGSALPSPGQSRTRLASEKGERHTKSRKKKNR